MTKRITNLILLLILLSSSAFAQRMTDKLDRGLVATIASSGSGNFISWRILANEYYDTKYNLYANGSLIAENLSLSNYSHSGGDASTTYQVAPVVKGVVGEKCAAVKRWSGDSYYSATGRHTGYLDVPTQKVYDRKGNDQTSNYELNDVSLADVDGDGVSELIVKRNYTLDDHTTANDSAFHMLECYKIDGTRLWYIDVGPNICGGPDEQYDIVGFDWDQDGKAEVLLRCADGAILHKADGTTQTIGDASKIYRNGGEYITSGAEYLLYLNGETLEPYVVMNYPLARGSVTDWGDGYGHRASKHYFGAPFLDGRNPYIFLARGCYTKHTMIAYSVDPSTHTLNKYWSWSCTDSSSPYYGQGYHNYAIADVDMDGRDEIVFGSMVIDDNGKGLSTTGLGHGDAQHCGDFDPYRWGLEQFACNESQPAMNYRNATTSKIYYRLQASGDDGRALCGNFTNSYPGATGRSVGSGMISCVADKPISEITDLITWNDLNFRIYWDGDLLDEVLNSPGTARAPKIEKPGTGRIFLGEGNMNNSSKNNPCVQGDIFGDWREEIVIRVGDVMRIYTTNYPTSYPIYTLWHDHQYRNAMVWQSIGYNQPPHVSYFLGELEGITVAPPPLTMTDRTEISNGGTIGTSANGKQVIVCETNDTKVSVENGASPWVAVFNVPSWVQGTNSTSTTNPTINYDYYTCTVSGSAFTGKTRLVKQGEGILTLPAVEQAYTGNTDIWGGTLNFDGTLKNSPLWLNRFTTLNSNGGSFRSISMEYGSKLYPGGADNAGTVTVDSLILGIGSRLVLDVYSDSNADKIVAGYVKINKKTWSYGPEYMQPVIEIVSHGDDSGKLTEGKYLLCELGEISGSADNITLTVANTYQKNNLVVEDGKLYLVVEDIRDAAYIIWNGNSSNIWDFAKAENFTLASDETQNQETFVNGDKVLFDDTSSKFTVNLTEDVVVDTVTVNNTKAYTFSGSGVITEGTFVKEGSGTVTISNDNTYTGGNILSGGTVKVSSLSNANQAYGNLGGVTTGRKFIMENGAVLQNTADVQMGSPIYMRGTDGGVINTTKTFTMNSPITGTKMTKKGSGTLNIYGTNSLTRMVIAQGTVNMGIESKPATTVEFQGGTLQDLNSTGSYSSYDYNVYVPEGSKGTWRLDGRCTYKNTLTGAGTITVVNPWYRCLLEGNWSAFTGTVVAQISDDGTSFPFNNTYGLPKATLQIPSGVEVTNGGKSFTIGVVTGEGKLGGNSPTTNGSNTWKVGNETNYTWKGSVTGSGTAFSKVGTGKLTMSGVSDHTGTTKVENGELHLNSSAVLGTGQLIVSKGATLSGTSSNSTNLTNSAVSVSGTLQVGMLATSVSGTLKFGNRNVNFVSGSTYICGAKQCATATNAGCTTMADIGKLTMNGEIKVFLSSKHTLQAGDSIRLWTSSSFTGSPTFDLPEGITWDTSRISEGLLFVVDVSTGINEIEIGNDDEVTVSVINVGGVVLDKFDCKYTDVVSRFRQSSLGEGVYILQVESANGRKAIKMRK